MPAKQAFSCQVRVAARCRVKHHLDDALHVAIQWCQRSDVHAQSAGDGRTHGVGIEPLTLYFAGLQDILGQRRKAGLIAQRDAHIGQPTEEQTLGTTDICQWPGQGRQVVTPCRPVSGLPDAGVIYVSHAVIMGTIHRCDKVFSAISAAIVSLFSARHQARTFQVPTASPARSSNATPSDSRVAFWPA